MDGNDLSEILSGTDTPDPEIAEVSTETTEQQQARDEAGRFASKEADDQAARAAVEGAVEHQESDGQVPQQALHAARQTAKSERDRADKLERDLAEMRGQISVLTQQRQPQTETKQPDKAPDPWDPKFGETLLTPVQQSITKQRYDVSRLLAEDKFGADVIDAADEALGALMQANDPSVLAIRQTMQTSRHPYADLVKWHENHKAMSEIGSDPAAYRAKVLAELKVELGLTEAALGAAVAQPSTTRPLTKIPPSLSRIAGGQTGAADTESLSDILSSR